MQDFNFQGIKFTFNPNISFSKIAYRKIKRWLGWFFVMILALIGLYGIIIPFKEFNGNFILAFRIFSATLLADMFLFYLWHYNKEKVRKIGSDKLAKAGEEGWIMEISLFLDKTIQRSLDKAWVLAYKNGYHYIHSIHIFSVFLENKEFKKILKRLNCQLDDVVDKTQKILVNIGRGNDDSQMGLRGPVLSPELEKIFFAAYLFCLDHRREQIGFLETLWAMGQQKNLVQMIFNEFGVRQEEIERVIIWAELERQIKKYEREFAWQKLFKSKKNLNRAMTAAATPLLNQISQDLTLMARQGQFELVVGREKEVAEIFNSFGSGQVGVILVGPNDVGKKSILKKIAQMMVKEDVPKFLQDKRLVRLDLGGLVSLGGASEHYEEYFRQVLYEVSRAGNIILVLENTDNLVGLKSQGGGLDFAGILASVLDNKTFYFIGTATSGEFASKIEGKILDQVLNRIDVMLPDRELLWQIIISKIFIIEKELKVLFSVDAVEEAINLADRYFYGDTLSLKVLEILEKVAFAAHNRPGKDNFVGKSDVVDYVVSKTDVPLGEVQKGEKEKLLNLESIIHQWLIDQEEAVNAVADALRRNRLYLQNLKKPICNFLFIGPTGVGKTELAKTLARVYFGDPKKMIRLDMSEYQERRDLRRIIGQRTAEGIQAGYLTEAVKRQPYSLLLLDEIEKAHPDILNLFLQVMDDGRLTDAGGEVINFTNIILIATSNAGTQFVQQKIKEGLSYENIDKQLRERVLLEYFHPEFLNRFDKIVLFKSLSLEDLFKITELMLGGVGKNLEEKGLKLEFENEAVEELARLGFNPLYGARALRRTIQDNVENAIAKLFLEDRISRRDILVLKKGLEIEIKKAPEL